ncbi:MAG: homoserine dehydrogenase [Gammaproteobacteria bacterium]|nr:homoserine dehydrogenase [Gammaproteobacteria bacterium]
MLGFCPVSSIIRGVSLLLFDKEFDKEFDREFRGSRLNTDPNKTINVGICGLGTVGGGTLSLLENNRADIEAKLGCSIEVTRVATRTLRPEVIAAFSGAGTDLFDVVNDPDVDIVVETVGGFDPAFELVKTALSNGKHVVTANKALIAERGNELFPVAEANGVTLAFESAVAGGIPIIKALREGLAANRIDSLAGIINGTGNFILTEMTDKQSQFEGVLKEAQDLGYAEADPAFDIEGTDAAHKLTIMASIAFGIPLQFDKTYTEGISHIEPEDILYAGELGCVIKHLGIARRSEKGVEMRVHPALIEKSRLLGNVHGVGNAVVVHGNEVGSTLYSGPGAGAGATASAVVADLIDIARQIQAGASTPFIPALGYCRENEGLEVLSIDEIESEYYLRILVSDVVGVLAGISGKLEKLAISIEAVIQKEAAGNLASIVILTHSALERQLNIAIAEIEAMDEVSGAVKRIRVAGFED